MLAGLPVPADAVHELADLVRGCGTSWPTGLSGLSPMR
jgi:hypothetical protein